LIRPVTFCLCSGGGACSSFEHPGNRKRKEISAKNKGNNLALCSIIFMVPPRVPGAPGIAAEKKFPQWLSVRPRSIFPSTRKDVSLREKAGFPLPGPEKDPPIDENIRIRTR